MLPAGGSDRSSELEWPKRPGIAKTLKPGGRSNGKQRRVTHDVRARGDRVTCARACRGAVRLCSPLCLQPSRRAPPETALLHNPRSHYCDVIDLAALENEASLFQRIFLERYVRRRVQAVRAC